MIFSILIAFAAMLGGWLLSIADDALRFRTLRRLLSRRDSSRAGPRGGARVALLALVRRFACGWRRGLGVVGGRVEQTESAKDRPQGLAVTLTFGRKG